MAMSDDDTYEGERAHLDAFWPDRVHEEFVWKLGPIGESLPRFRVRRSHQLGGAIHGCM